ncbi:Asp23/Gls24 family envelope stress response protein [Xylocopilactobacillus apicola]|uniref:Asp23/Gls24 family envelope stress response protein n=1 Tax=Xylocopilactobacillus apicola TaxID=2932184 RepID=A0AAU9DW25_9LACO|nr:Asp23/Gls24 family envelope stress response protein [Xylocopilactobacillus apicola]BDR58143.1 hypothetical protein XA3_05840 [Xylocopilactobacillus apicola]
MANLRSGLKLSSSNTVAGKVSISAKALETIMELTAGSVKDVNKMTRVFQTVFGSNFPEVRFVHAATLKLVNHELVAEIYLNLNYGVNVIQTTYQVQSEIINQFKEMLDLDLAKVQVHVVDLIDDDQIVDEA